MDMRLRMYLAELFGTFMVVFLAAGAVCASYLPAADPHYYSLGGVTLSVALAYGLSLAVAVSATSWLSLGCCNPAITLALFVTRRLEFGRTLGLIAVQLFGSFLAALALRGLFSPDVLVDARMGAPHLGALLDSTGEVTLAALASGVGVEFLLTFFLCVAAFATLLDPQVRTQYPRPALSGLGLGSTQIAVVLVGFHLTGGAANPARWFGPAVWQLSLAMNVHRPLADHPVYWVGPVFGALAGSIFYSAVLARDGKPVRD